MPATTNSAVLRSTFTVAASSNAPTTQRGCENHTFPSRPRSPRIGRWIRHRLQRRFRSVERGVDGVLEVHRGVAGDLFERAVGDHHVVRHRVDQGPGRRQIDIGDEAEPPRRQSGREDRHRHHQQALAHVSGDGAKHVAVGGRLGRTDLVVTRGHVRARAASTNARNGIGEGDRLGAGIHPFGRHHHRQALDQLAEDLPAQAALSTLPCPTTIPARRATVSTSSARIRSTSRRLRRCSDRSSESSPSPPRYTTLRTPLAAACRPNALAPEASRVGEVGSLERVHEVVRDVDPGHRFDQRRRIGRRHRRPAEPRRDRRSTASGS